MKWIVVASTVMARVYVINKCEGHKHLTLVKELEHSEGLKKDQDFVSDRAGHYQVGSSVHGSFAESDAKEIHNDRFAQEITHFLDQARNEHQFESFTLVVAPHFLGMLEKHFKKPLKDLINHRIEKNIVNLSHHELEQFLATELHHPD